MIRYHFSPRGDYRYRCKIFRYLFFPLSKTVFFFPTSRNWWGISILFWETVFFFPTSGEFRYRFGKLYIFSPPVGLGGEFRYRFRKRYFLSPLVGSIDTVLKNGIFFPHQRGLVRNIDTVLGNGILFPHWFNLVGNSDTHFGNGIFFTHQWGIKIPFLKRVSIFPTGGEKRYRFGKRYPFYPLVELGGEFRYPFWERYQYSPPVGNVDTDFGNGIDISHWWGILIPFWETVSFFPTHLSAHLFSGMILKHLISNNSGGNDKIPTQGTYVHVHVPHIHPSLREMAPASYTFGK